MDAFDARETPEDADAGEPAFPLRDPVSSQDATVQLAGKETAFAVASIAIACFLWWLGWSALLQLALWAIIAASSFGMVYVVWDAVSDKSPANGRNRQWILASGLAVISCIGYFALGLLVKDTTQTSELASSTPTHRLRTAPEQTSESKSVDATIKYWYQLKNINDSLSRNVNSSQVDTLPQAIAHLRATTGTLTQAADRISVLPVQDVDMKVVAYGAEQMRLLQDAERIISERVGILSNKQELQEYAESPEVFVESTIRGFMGDPFGKYQELQQYDQRLGSDFAQSESEYAQLRKEANRLRSDSHRLRAELSSRFRYEFPPID